MSVTNDGSLKLYIPQGSVYFAGGTSDELIEVSYNTLLCPPNKLTLAMWIKSDASNSERYIIAKGLPNADYGFQIHTNTSQADFIINNGARAITTSDVNDGEWHHLVGTYDSTAGGTDEVKLYVDGELDATGDYSTAITHDLSPLIIAAKTDVGGYEWGGYINDIKFFNGNALSADEVRQLYNGIEITDGLVAHWKFDEKTGLKIVDEINSISGNFAGDLGRGGTNPTWKDRDIQCWGTRWDETNDGMTFETFMDACDRNYLMDNVTPKAVRELYNILGTKKFIDTTFTSSNTLIIEPIDGYGISSLVEKKTIGVKNIRTRLINSETYGVKIEGIFL